MPSVSSNTKRSQSPQFSDTLDSQTINKGDDQVANPLRMKVKKVPVKDVKVAPTNSSVVKGVIAPVKATVASVPYKTLGVWNDVSTSAPSAAPSVSVATKEASAPVVASLPALGSNKGDHNKSRNRSKSRECEKPKLVAKKMIRHRSKSSSSESKCSTLASPRRDPTETPSKCSSRSPSPVKCAPKKEKRVSPVVHRRRESSRSPLKLLPKKKSPPVVHKKKSPKKDRRFSTPSKKKCSPVAAPVPVPGRSCTECNPEGSMCAPITISDIFRLFKSEHANDFTRHVARSILAGLKCPPSLVGREFWTDFDYTPTVFVPKPSETCHCGDKRKDCKCIVSDLTVCKDAVSLDTFNFHYPSIEAKDGEVTLYPFGCGCVPSPLKICEEARFTIYAVKRTLEKNCGVTKGDDDDVNYDYIIQWAYDALKCGETLNEGVRELICCTLRSLKGKESCLSDSLHEKYCFVQRELNKNSKDYECTPSRPRQHRSPSPDRRRARECGPVRRLSPECSPSRHYSPVKDRARSRSSTPERSRRQRDQSRSYTPERQRDYSRSYTPEHKPVCRRERRRSPSPIQECSREQSLTSPVRFERRRSLSRERVPPTPSCTSPEPSCKECGYSSDKCRCCSKCHYLKCQCEHVKAPKDKSCNKCKKPEEKCRCIFPVVPESPFAVFHVSGKWICEEVNCDSACMEGTRGTKYRIVLDESNLNHVDGGLVCEGWSWFTPARYSSYFFKMCPQRLDFFPSTPAVEGCGC